MTKTKYLPVILILGSFLGSYPVRAFTQTTPKDSLLQEVKELPSDTDRIDKLVAHTKVLQFTNVTDALEFSWMALRLARNAGSDKHLQKALLGLGSCYFYIGRLEDAVRYYTEYWDRAVTSGNKREQLSARLNFNSVRLSEAKFDSLLEEQLLETLALAQAFVQETGDSVVAYSWIPMIYNHLSYLYQFKEDFLQAEEFLKKGMDIVAGRPSGQDKLLQAQFAYAGMLIRQGKGEEALAVGKSILQSPTLLNRPMMYATARLHVAEAYELLEKDAEALRHYNSAFSLARDNSLSLDLIYIGRRLANLYERMGRPDSVVFFLNQVKVHEQQTAFDAAYKKLVRLEMDNKIRELEAGFQEKKQSSLVRWLALSAFLLFVGLGATVLSISLRKKYRLARLEKMQADFKAQELALEKQMLSIQIQNQSKQLTVETMYRIQRNEIVREVLDKLMELERKEPKDVRETLRSTVNRLEKSLEGQAWEDFEMRFQKVNSDFYRKLLELHPGLTTNERRLCALIRLDLNNPEIAAMMGQTPATLRVARHRLRQKLVLNEGEMALEEYLLSL